MFEAPIPGNEQIAFPKLWGEREKKTFLSSTLRNSLSAMSPARSLFREEKFQEKPLGQGYSQEAARQKTIFAKHFE